MVTDYWRTYEIRFTTGPFEYNLLVTTDKREYSEIEQEVRDYMKKEYRVNSGSMTITPLELGIIEL